jgi:hypothetical protein
MQGDMEGGPFFSRDLFDVRGRLTRLHKGGGGATAEALKGREQSAAQFREQMDLMKRQNAAAEVQAKEAREAAKRPVADPLPVSGDEAGMNAGMSERINAAKRKGLRYSLLSQDSAKSTLLV